MRLRRAAASGEAQAQAQQAPGGMPMYTQRQAARARASETRDDTGSLLTGSFVFGQQLLRPEGAVMKMAVSM